MALFFLPTVLKNNKKILQETPSTIKVILSIVPALAVPAITQFSA